MMPRVSHWEESKKTGLQGFVGYKAGMLQILAIEDRDNPLKNQEVVKAVTVLETPPIFVYSICAYETTPEGIKKIAEIPATANVPKEIQRSITVAKKAKMKMEDLEKISEKISAVRIIACSQPWKIGLKKTPEVFEVDISGANAAEKLNYAKGLLGKEARIQDVFTDGEYADLIAVTKGKGWQGIIKRFGVALNPRKATKSRRHGGSIGPERQGKVMYTIPRAGQMGFHKRTEKSKRILKIGESAKAKEIVPSGGFIDYGTVKGDFILIEGSVSGTEKRAVRLRKTSLMQGKKPDIRKFLINGAGRV